MHPYLDSEQAAQLLGVRKATLYSYVSRGLIQSLAGDMPHASKFRRSEVEQLARRQAQKRKPRQAARAALDWGLPVLESELTLIEDGRLYYRGISLAGLLPHASLEDVAGLLWQEEYPRNAMPGLSAHWHKTARAMRDSSAFERTLPLFALGQAEFAWGDGDAADSFLHLMAACVLGSAPSGKPLLEQCALAWGLNGSQADVVRIALLCCADHELNASSFTARCIAATGAGMGAALSGALAALSGPLHGGFTEKIETLFDAAANARAIRPVLEAELDRHAMLPGFGHPLYPAGDPRAIALLKTLPANRRLGRFIDDAAVLCGQAPSIDFALVAARRCLGLPRGSAFGLFALARTVGWIAHILEQRRSPGLIRPRALYAGPRPQAPQQGRIIRSGRGPVSRGAWPVHD